MQTRDNLALFRHITKDVVKKYEKGMRDKLDEHARPVHFLEGDLVYMYDPTLTKPTNKPHPNNKEVSDQSRRFHTQPESANVEYLAESAGAENWARQPAPLNMESPFFHWGPTENHDESPGGRPAGQNHTDLTDCDAQASRELGPVSKNKNLVTRMVPCYFTEK